MIEDKTIARLQLIAEHLVFLGKSEDAAIIFKIIRFFEETKIDIYNNYEYLIPFVSKGFQEK